MEPDTGMMDVEHDLQRVAAPTDRRPEFVAEGLSPRFRLGLLGGTLLADALLVANVFIMSFRTDGLATTSLWGPLLGGMMMVVTFAVLLIFGALVGNDSRIGPVERGIWWASFLLAGPIALPLYWYVHVAPREYLPRAESHA